MIHTPKDTNAFPILSQLSNSPLYDHARLTMMELAKNSISRLNRHAGSLDLSVTVWVHLVGKPGRGKTALQEALQNHVIMAGHGESICYAKRPGEYDDILFCYKYKERELNHLMKRSLGKEYFAVWESKEEAKKESGEQPAPAIVVLDDLFYRCNRPLRDGPASSGSWSTGFYALGFEEVVTILTENPVLLITTSNFTQQEIIEFAGKRSQAVGSRLMGFQKMELVLDGPDRRLHNGMEHPDSDLSCLLGKNNISPKKPADLRLMDGAGI